ALRSRIRNPRRRPHLRRKRACQSNQCSACRQQNTQTLTTEGPVRRAPRRVSHRPAHVGYARTRRMVLQFAKYEGLGNDFIVVDAMGMSALPLSTIEARAVCDRHRGIGADGVLFIEGDKTKPRMRVINADGSQPEMCGNGLRCVALHLVRRGVAAPSSNFVVD